MSFYIDLPKLPPDPASDDDRWVNVAVVATRAEAEELLESHWGIHPMFSAPFVSEGEADLLPPIWEREEATQ